MRPTFLLMTWLFASCERGLMPSAPTEPTMQAVFNARGPVAVTPSGWFAIYAHEYGAVLPWHIETADAAWRYVAPCVGIELRRISRFPVFLTSAPREGENRTPAGALHQFSVDGGGYIEIIGGSYDFDPATPAANPAAGREIARLWRHEQIHLALGLRDGNVDPAHEAPDWACQWGG